MSNRDVLILKGDEIEAALQGRELEIIATVEAAYKVHAAGDSSLPNSLFLRFPNDERNRIIALPAYLGEEFNVAGMKWVSSFPGNLDQGLNRASAVIIMNSAKTGRAEVIMEGSLISAKRTAASAALAARCIHAGSAPEAIGILGCGPINFEVTRFLSVVCPKIDRLLVFDVDASRAMQFKENCAELNSGWRVEVVAESRQVFQDANLVSLATSAIHPHIFDVSMCPAGSTILHISLRDFSPEVILSVDNVVDHTDHVCRAQTSVHLAEQIAGNRDFIRCTLADIANGVAASKSSDDAVTIFSPFGLGVLDLAVANLASDLAVERGFGTIIESFLPPSYSEKRLARSTTGNEEH
jgi:N-[(2S)-2-amino-2-carboxyethyl]-L-glutamate dehydrogenase